MKTIEALLEGYRDFYKTHFVGGVNARYQRLADQGQSPKVMMIACSDSRVDPATITQSGPGDLFLARNVANLVPPCRSAKGVEHGTASVLEYAVCHLKVSDVVIMGHSLCGGIRALMEGVPANDSTTFIPDWLNMAAEARKKVQDTLPNRPIEEQAAACEREALALSFNNLMTYPWVNRAVASKQLALHTWHFDIRSGKLQTIASRRSP